MIAPFSRVRLDKLSTQNAGVLPDAYWLIGHIIDAPTVGQTLRVYRTERARQRLDEVEPVKVEGIYVSSPVRTITDQEDGSVVCQTANSHWKVTPIAEEKA